MKATHYIYVLFAALFTLACTGCEDRLNIEKHGSLGVPRITIELMQRLRLPWLLCLFPGVMYIPIGFM